MILVERHYIKGTEEIIKLCSTSKELYNRCTFLMRQAWFSKKPLPSINTLVKASKSLNCYKQLHNTKTAAQTIRKCLTDWGNFRKSLIAYKKDKSKFIRCPKPPKYKEKLAQVIFFRETIKGGQYHKVLSNLTPTNNCLSVPFKEGYKQVVITPKTFGFVIEVQYEAKDKEKRALNKDKICTIDVGLNTLAAITLDQARPILINGRILKSINQWYNKKPCKTRLRKRYWRIENYFHHTSKLIIDLCLKHNIGKIIIGRNEGWKQNINLGKKNNQAFCMIPIYLLLEKIKYKASILGVEVIFTDESYTSKASFYDRDLMINVTEFSGKRKYRGLYISNGFAINADVNGSMNIGRKVIPEFLGIRDRSLAARPLAINPLKA